MMLTSIDQIQNNVLYGVAYGYKECCIKYFHRRQFNGDMFKGLQHKLTGTGFICCPECNENFTEDEIKADIKKHRLCKDEFPSYKDIDLREIEFDTEQIQKMNMMVSDISHELKIY